MSRWSRRLVKTCLICWAAPNSLLGLSIGLVGLCFGTRVRFKGGCIEFWGGLVTWLLNRTPVRAVAMTLGHTILGVDCRYLDRAARHERVHVRQYERWGPLFLIAYLGSSVWIWWRGGNPYLDNPFEIEAYREAP